MGDHFHLWLHYVDKQLSAEAFEFLKLGFHSELRRYYTEVEKLDKPSLLYHFLLNSKQRTHQSESQVLQMFLYVIEALGKKLRSDIVIKKGFGESSVYKLAHPGSFDIQSASKEFKFFVCLLKILIKVRQDVILCDQIKTKFTRGRFLDVNHRHVKNLAELFIWLCQKGFITPDDTLYLQQALIKHEAWECLLILNGYHESVGMMPIRRAEKAYPVGGIYSSSDPTSAVDTSVSDALAPCQYKKAFHEHPKEEIDDDYHRDTKVFFDDTVHAYSSPKPGGALDEDDDSGILASESTRMLTRTPEVDWSNTEKMIKGTGDNIGEGGFDRAQSTTSTKFGFKVLWLFFAILFGLFLVISIVVLLLKAWVPLEPVPPDATPVHNGSIIIVKEIDSLFHKVVVVKENLNNSSDFNLDIHFYGMQGRCDGKNVIQIPSRTVILTEMNTSSYIPDYYALEGSYFNYKISGSSGNPSRVEVCAYRESVDSVNNEDTSEQCVRLAFGQGSGYYRVPEPGYYFFRVEPHEELIDYKLSITETLRILTTNLHESLECSINNTNSECQFSLPLKPKYCLMAKLYQSIGISDVDLEVQVRESRFEIMLAIPLSALVLLIMLQVFVLVSVPLCYLKFCINRQSRVV